MVFISFCGVGHVFELSRGERERERGGGGGERTTTTKKKQQQKQLETMSGLFLYFQATLALIQTHERLKRTLILMGQWKTRP